MTRLKLNAKQIMTLCLAGISAGAVIVAIAWPLKAALFPLIIGTSVFLLSLIELTLSLSRREGLSERSSVDSIPSKDVDRQTVIRRTLVTLVWILGFFTLILLIGFSLAVPIFVFFYLRNQGKEKWLFSIVMAGCSWLFFWGLFIWILDTPMPKSLGFKLLKAIGLL